MPPHLPPRQLPKKIKTYKEKLYSELPPDKQPPRVTGGVRNAQYRLLRAAAMQSYTNPPTVIAVAAEGNEEGAAGNRDSFSSTTSLPPAVGDLRNSHHFDQHRIQAAPSRGTNSSASTVRPLRLPPRPSGASCYDTRIENNGAENSWGAIPLSSSNATPLPARTSRQAAGFGYLADSKVAEDLASFHQHSYRRQVPLIAPASQDGLPPEEDNDDWGAPPRTVARSSIGHPLVLTEVSSQSTIPSLGRSPPQPRNPPIWQAAHFETSRHRHPQCNQTPPRKEGDLSAASVSTRHPPGTDYTRASVRRVAPWGEDSPERTDPSLASDRPSNGSSRNDPSDSGPPSPSPQQAIPFRGTDTAQMVSPRTLDEVLDRLRGKIVDEQGRNREGRSSRAGDRDEYRSRDYERVRDEDSPELGRANRLSRLRGRISPIGESGGGRTSYRDRSRGREQERDRERERDRSEKQRDRDSERREERKVRARRDEVVEELQEENASQKRNIDRLTDRLDRVLAEREVLQATDTSSELRTLRAKTAKLEESLFDSQAKVAELKRQVALASPSRRDSQSDAAMSALLDEVEAMRADKNTLDFKLKALGELLEDEKAQRKQSDDAAHSARAHQSQLAQQKGELEARLNGIGRELAAQQRARQLAADRLREVEGSLGNIELLKRELIAAKKQIDTLGQQVHTEQARVKAANDRYDGKSQQFDAQQDKVRQLRRENDGLQAEHKELEGKIAKYRDQAKSHNKALDALRDCRVINDRMKRQEREMKEKLADARSEITRLNRVLEEQQRAVSRLQQSHAPSSRSQSGSFDEEHDEQVEEEAKPRVRAEERFKQFDALRHDAISRARTTVPTLDGREEQLPTLGSSLNGAILQPDNKRKPTPFDPAPIDFEQYRPKSRAASSSTLQAGRGSASHDVKPKAPGGIDWRVITPARPRSAAPSQASLFDMDVKMSDSGSVSEHMPSVAEADEEGGAVAEVVSNGEDEHKEQGYEDASKSTTTTPLMLDGSNDLESAAVKTPGAANKYETPMTCRSPARDSSIKGVLTRSSGSRSDRTQRTAVSGGSVQSGASNSTVRQQTPLMAVDGRADVEQVRKDHRIPATQDERVQDDHHPAASPLQEMMLKRNLPLSTPATAKSTSSSLSDGAAGTQTTKIRRIKDMLYDPFANIGDDFGLSLPKTTTSSSDKDTSTSAHLAATASPPLPPHLQAPQAPAPTRKAYDQGASPPTPCPSNAAGQEFKISLSSSERDLFGPHSA